jgi:hypothetical protein
MKRKDKSIIETNPTLPSNNVVALPHFKTNWCVPGKIGACLMAKYGNKTINQSYQSLEYHNLIARLFDFMG